MNLSGKTVLITGGAGFIGSHVTEAFLESGANVRVFFHYNGKQDTGVLDHSVLSKIDKVYGAITDAGAVRDAVKGCDVVIHMASIPGIPYSYEHPQEVFDVNAGGALNVLNACLAERDTVKRIVTTSTSEVYGSADVLPITERSPLKPQSPYAAAKVAADALAGSFYCSYGLPVVIARLFNTMGPRQSARALIPAVIKQALWADKIMVGSLTPKRDYLYARDAASAFVRCAMADDKVNGELIHFGTGKLYSVREVIDMVQDIIDIDNRKSVESVPYRMRPNASEVTHLLCDPSKAEQLLGWQPTVQLNQGLAHTIEYMKRNLDKYDPTSYSK